MRQRLLPGSAIFFGSLAIFAISAAVAGIPIPKVHDEFSYLLAGDTFAHGRMTNPPHPQWQHFESFHILQQPSYQSKYPPGQGLALAVGQLLWHPILGVWLSTAAACVALFWCLSRWLPLKWAIIGSAATALHPLVLRWSQSYWGGSVALLGGALVVGAIRNPSPRAVAVAATGVMILANSRPFEGLVLAVLAAPFLLRHVRWAAVAIVLAGFAWMAYYNHRVTGRALELPYVVHERQYAVVPLFIVQDLKPVPQYRHERLRQFHAGWAVSEYMKQKEQGYAGAAVEKLARLVRGAFRLFLPSMDGERFGAPFPAIYLSSFLLIPLLGAFAAARKDRWLAGAGLLLLIFSAAMTMPTWMLPHYAAPAAPLLIVLMTGGLVHVSLLRIGSVRVGAIVLAIGALIWISSAVYSVRIMQAGQQVAVGTWVNAFRKADPPSQLSVGQHLVIVRYPEGSPLHFEWVYNGAAIDRQGVVWARDMGTNEAVLSHFRGRTVWLLTDGDPPRLTMAVSQP